MMKKLTKYGIIIIAAVLVIAMAFAGAASADKPIIINIKDATEWKNKVTYFKTLDDTYVINLTGNLDFKGYTTSDIVVSWNASGCPNIEGNGYTISNFNISGGKGFGLFGYYYGTRIANLTLSNFSVSGSDFVGGLVGYAKSAIHIENVRVQYGNVTGSGAVGGLVGNAFYASWLNESSAERMYVSGITSGNVGGLVGRAASASYVKDSWVNVSEVVGSGYVGGLVGRATFASDYEGCAVENCTIAGSDRVGGLVGYANSTSNVTGCLVENCTIAGSEKVGGLVGYAKSTSSFAFPQTWVNATWVNGSSQIGSLFGSSPTITDFSPAPGHSKVYNSTTTVNSTVSGVDNSFNGTITYSPENLSKLGIGSVIDRNGLIAGKDYGYGSVPPTPYPIWITNASGTYQLTSAMTKVFGDDGSGYAELTAVSGDTYTLELNGFNASNMTGNVPIINASVPNLTIKLVGDSNLTGSLNANTQGVLNTSGNLMITKEGEGTLLVNNNAGSSGNAVYAENDVTINDGTVNATATSSAIYANSGRIIIEDGTVNATAHKHAINAKDTVIIKDGTIKATAFDEGGIAICSDDKCIIEDGTVNAIATGTFGMAICTNDIIIYAGMITSTVTNNTGYAIETRNLTIMGGTVNVAATGVDGYGICANNKCIIEDGTVNATATGSGGYAIYANNEFIINDGTVNATADKYAICVTSGNATIDGGTVNAIATGSGGYAIFAASGDITIGDATINAAADMSAIIAGNDLTINGGMVNATVTWYGIYATYNVTINDGTVTATATGDDSGIAIYSAGGNITIEDGQVTATADGFAIEAESATVTINDGTVTAIGVGGDAIFATNEVIIEGGTINATATGDKSAISTYGAITIASVDQLIANGSMAAFVYFTQRDFSALGNDYEYWVNATSGTEPTVKLTYEQFNSSEKWTQNEIIPVLQSVYTNVLIKKPVAPTPVYHSSSSRQTGSTVILQPGQVAPTQVPTVAPTVKPTAAPTEIPGGQTTVVPTVKPTAQPTQTQASPAPILGLIAGLGIAGLVLRLRK